MTEGHVKRLQTLVEQNSRSNETAVLNAVRIVGNPLPKEIKQYLDNIAKDEVIKDYESGKINKEDIKRNIKDKTIDIRTIHRKLASLKHKGLLDHKDNRYSISQKADQDIRYFADTFRLIIGATVGKFPVISVEQTIVEFVRRFGALIIYAFIEAASPINDDSMTLAEKDKLTMDWVRNVIPIESFYSKFYSVFIEKNRRFDGSQSLTTLNKTTIRKLKRTLKKCYPDIFEDILSQRVDFRKGTKSAYLTDKNNPKWLSPSRIPINLWMSEKEFMK